MEPAVDVHNVDVLIVGAGPAGLAAAVTLKARGIKSVTIVERETQAGGIPRHCAHPPFGMHEFGRVLNGPGYASRLVLQAIEAGVDLKRGCAAVAIERADDLKVKCATSRGMLTFVAQRVILATGVRERPRAARLVSGSRPLGVLNTGALQEYAHIEKLAPFRRPLIVGTELVSLSSLLTCRKIRSEPVAMIEARARPLVRQPLMLLPRLFGVPVRYGTRIIDIRGEKRVESVKVLGPDGAQDDIDCDGILFTGSFKPEASLARASGLSIDSGSGGPAIDQFGRTSDARIFAAGNILHPVETAGWSWREGRRIGDMIALDLAGHLPARGHVIRMLAGEGIQYVVPQRLVAGGKGVSSLQIRASQSFSGALIAYCNGRPIWQRRLTTGPERRILCPISRFENAQSDVIFALQTERHDVFQADVLCA
jgi:thioredoxin reductase